MNEQDAQEKRDTAEVPQINIEPLREVINEVVSNMNPVINALMNDEALATIRGIVERLKSEHAPAFKYLEYLRTLEPYIKAEAESDEAYFTILEAVDLDFTTTSPEVKRIIDRAAERAYEAEGIEIIELSLIAEDEERPEASDPVNLSDLKIIQSLDPINSKIFGARAEVFEYMQNGGMIPIKANKDNDADLDIMFNAMFNFDEMAQGVKLSNTLEQADKDIYTAIQSLYYGEIKADMSDLPQNEPLNEPATISATSIYRAIHGTPDTNPGARDIQEIVDRINKMLRCTASIDNTEEANRYKYPRVKYTTQLLRADTVSVTFNGGTTDAAIKIIQEPVLGYFATRRGQFTTYSMHHNRLKYIDNGKTRQVKLTENNSKLRSYLFGRIHGYQRDINNLTGRKIGEQVWAEKLILINTICERMEITRNKTRFKEKNIIPMLEVMKTNRKIAGYQITTNKKGEEAIRIKLYKTK